MSVTRKWSWGDMSVIANDALVLNPNDEYRSRDGDPSSNCRRHFGLLAFDRGDKT